MAKEIVEEFTENYKKKFKFPKFNPDFLDNDLDYEIKKIIKDIHDDLIENYNVITTKTKMNGCSKLWLTYGFEVNINYNEINIRNNKNNYHSDKEYYNDLENCENDFINYNLNIIKNMNSDKIKFLKYNCCWKNELNKYGITGIPIYEFNLNKRDNHSQFIKKIYNDQNINITQLTNPSTYYIQENVLDDILDYECSNPNFMNLNIGNINNEIATLYDFSILNNLKLVWRMVPDNCYCCT